jgi:hypothetical protein
MEEERYQSDLDYCPTVRLEETKENHEILHLVPQLTTIGIRAVFSAITIIHSVDNMSLISVCLFPAVRVSLFVYMEGSGV